MRKRPWKKSVFEEEKENEKKGVRGVNGQIGGGRRDGCKRRRRRWKERVVKVEVKQEEEMDKERAEEHTKE